MSTAPMCGHAESCDDCRAKGKRCYCPRVIDEHEADQ